MSMLVAQSKTAPTSKVHHSAIASTSVVEASNRQGLAELTVQALALVETMTEHLQLLPTRDGYNPHILRKSLFKG